MRGAMAITAASATTHASSMRRRRRKARSASAARRPVTGKAVRVIGSPSRFRLPPTQPAARRGGCATPARMNLRLPPEEYEDRPGGRLADPWRLPTLELVKFARVRRSLVVDAVLAAAVVALALPAIASGHVGSPGSPGS